MFVVGVDGCRGGWLAVRLEGRAPPTLAVFATAKDLVDAWGDAALTLVDIPIGLPDPGRPQRTCDREARHLLGARRASVFPPPCRAALAAPTHAAASRINRDCLGRGLSLQAWNIAPRIAEFDELLRSTPELRGRLHEAHPELCFLAFAGGGALSAPKRTPRGGSERLRLLRRLDPRAAEAATEAGRRFRRGAVTRDDVLDALALAFAAARGAGGLAALPAAPEADACGLPMSISYPREAR